MRGKVQTPAQQWRSLVAEMRRTLNEAPDPKEEGEDSLDNQVDRYFTNYEKEAKLAKQEARDWRGFVRRLVEAEDDPKKEDEEKDDKEQKLKKLKSTDIDITSFLDSVMRLVENYDSLLEVRDTILRRAVNFIGKNYEKDTIQQFKDSLRDVYGFDIGKSVEDVNDEQNPAPAASRAGPNPGGGTA